MQKQEIKMNETKTHNTKTKQESATKKIVVPGELLGKGKKPGANVTIKESQLFSSVVGFVNESPDRISVVPLEGAYKPYRNDLIIGVVIGERFAGFDTNINSFFSLIQFFLAQRAACSRSTTFIFLKTL